MSKRIADNVHLLHLLCTCNNRQRIALIETLNKEQLLAICECVANVIEGNVHVNKSTYSKIFRKREILRELIKRKPSQIKKKRALIQVGGALPALLIPAISLATSIIGSLIG